MRVTHLSLRSWRNYAQAEIEFEPGVTVLIGTNGQGKTNLVEAIGVLSTLRSHRVSAQQALIQEGADAAVVRARLVNGDREILAELQLNRSAPNTAQLNRSSVKARELTRYCHSVIFAPEDLSIVRGDPADRRAFLDELLVQLSPRLAGVLADYDRVVRQRNTLLKTSRGLTQLSTLEIWNEKLVQLGSEIIRERQGLIERLREPLSAAYHFVVHDDHHPMLDLELSWGGAVGEDVAGVFTHELSQLAAKERERGLTLIGPHRDELRFSLNNLPVKGYASHGESWSFVLALKLAAAEILRRESQVGDPIIILDDVFAELDRSRRERLAAAMDGFEQVLVTAAVAEDVPTALLERRWYVRAGQVSAHPFEAANE